MARVPVIDSPCPIAGKGLPAGASEHCTLCDRPVHNLDLMNASQRRDFLQACGGKVCVAYTVRIPTVGPRRRGLAAAVAVAALASLPVAADESPVLAQSPVSGEVELPNCEDWTDIVLTDGVTRADAAEWTDDGKQPTEELPAIEDDGR
jgi:hypothetical protein